MKHTELAAQIREIFAPRIIDDAWDAGFAAGIEAASQFLEAKDNGK